MQDVVLLCFMEQLSLCLTAQSQIKCLPKKKVRGCLCNVGGTVRRTDCTYCILEVWPWPEVLVFWGSASKLNHEDHILWHLLALTSLPLILWPLFKWFHGDQCKHVSYSSFSEILLIKSRAGLKGGNRRRAVFSAPGEVQDPGLT